MLKFCETKQIGISNPNPGFIYSLNNEHMGVFLVITFQTWLFYLFVELYFCLSSNSNKKKQLVDFLMQIMMYGRQYCLLEVAKLSLKYYMKVFLHK